jgi:hypothetical protein
MKPITRFALALLLASGVSCSSSLKPAAINVGDQCFRCRRPIVETRLAAEIIDANGLAYKFRGAGCLAKYLADHPSDSGTIFVTDFASGKMMQIAGMSFVPVIVDENTNEGDYRVYADKTEAATAAKALNVTPLDWQGVLSKAQSQS